jgi:hypothetical protein
LAGRGNFRGAPTFGQIVMGYFAKGFDFAAPPNFEGTSKVVPGRLERRS